MVTDESKTKACGRSCFRTLALGFLIIAYDVVDQCGSGTLRFGPKTYTVYLDPAESGGVERGAICNSSELHVKCLATGLLLLSRPSCPPA
jgi:hypothetical protein